MFVTSQFVFVETGDTPEKLKSCICRSLKNNLLKTSEFKAIYEQTGRALHKDDDNANAKLGAHSNRKYAKTRPLCRGNCNEKEVDWCGRWKDMAHASSVYADTVLSFPGFYSKSMTMGLMVANQQKISMMQKGAKCQAPIAKGIMYGS